MPIVRKSKSTIQASDDLVVIGDDNRIMGNAVNLVVQGNDNVIYADKAKIEGDENTINGNHCDVTGNDNIIMGIRGKVSGTGNMDMSLPEPPSGSAGPFHIGDFNAGEGGGASRFDGVATAQRFNGTRHGARAGKYSTLIQPGEERTTAVWVNNRQVSGSPRRRGPTQPSSRAEVIAAQLSGILLAEMLSMERTNPTTMVIRGERMGSEGPGVVREGAAESFPRLEGDDVEAGDPEKACAVCKENVPCVLFIPCNHLHTCKACSRTMSVSAEFNCPMCRVAVSAWRPVFQ